ncbi:MAG: sugar phosphate isomerase/epimerase [Clostridia bacterium]|nr:sugar phosphate isomerase/epimerase [Clostridia bacterium]
MKLGTMVHLGDNVVEKIKDVKKYGLESFQLCCWNLSYFTEEWAERVKKTADEEGLEISAVWCGWEGEAAWNFTRGPITLGIVPTFFRHMRIENLKKGSDFAKLMGVTDFITHMGFIPENPITDEYQGVVSAVRELAEYCKANGQYLLFETGQETPITLKRIILDVNTGNLGINLDPANLLLYGKANPCDAVDVFGDYVRGVHGKDGEYPTDPRNLGEEKRIGDGRVNFPVLIKKLKEHGYNGSITIEREIDGDKQIEDVLYAKKFLEDIING